MMQSRKRFGQHFLEPAWVNKLVDAIGPRPDDRFLEIGPGHGAITRPLAAVAREIVAVEIDRDLVAELRRTMPPNVRIVEGDVLETDVGTLIDPPTRVVGNLPYSISSPILFRLVELSRAQPHSLHLPLFTDATLMLQREVADRLVAKPGTSEYGVLGILIGVHAEVSRLHTLPPGAFRPAPKVSSAVVRLTFRPPPVPIPDSALFEAMVQSIFTKRRKTMSNALRVFGQSRGVNPGDLLRRAGIDPRRRPETLDVAELARLTELFASST